MVVDIDKSENSAYIADQNDSSVLGPFWPFLRGVQA